MIPRSQLTAGLAVLVSILVTAAWGQVPQAQTPLKKAPPTQVPQGLPQPIVPQPFGVNIHFVTPDAAEADALAAVGYRFVRMDFGWGSIERKAGEYDFAGYDKLVEGMSQRQVRLLFILDYANKLYDNGVAPHTPEGRAAFARYAAAAAKHYAGKGIIWEIWNEPNLAQFWKPKPSAADYADLVIQTIKAVRQADPQAFIVGPASSEFPWEFFRVLAERQVLGQFDAISVHPYRQTNPETAQADYQRLRLLLDRASPGKRLAIISGEWGYSTGWKNLSEELQSQYIVRQWLFNLASDVGLSIWYDWKDDGADPKEPEHHFGSVYRDLKPKPAAVAARTLCNTLRDYRYVRRVNMPDNRDFVLVFQKEGKPALAVWTTAEPHIVPLALPAGQVDVVDIAGGHKELTSNSEGLPLRVGPAVRYLFPQGDLRQLAQLGCWAPQVSVMSVTAGKPNTLVATVANPTDQPLRGQVILDIDGKAISQQEFSLPANAPAKPVTLSLNITGHGRQTLLGVVKMRADGAGDRPLQQSPVTLLVTNAVSASVLPPVKTDVMVILENPSGQALKGDVRVTNGAETVGAPVELAAGQTQTKVVVRMSQITSDSPIEVTGTTANGLGMFAGRVLVWRSIALKTPNETAKAWLEGDAKVAGDVAVQWTKLPEPAPQAGLIEGLEVKYRFAQGWRFTCIAPPPSAAEIPGKPHKLGMWVYGDGSGNALRCRFKDATGQMFQPTFGQIDWTGWRWVSVAIDGKDTSHFGGANDGVMHYPIRWDSIALIDSNKLSVDRDLRVFLAGLAMEY